MIKLDPLNGLESKPDDCSPEKRLWIMVLETFVDDMILHNKYIKFSNKKLASANAYLKQGHINSIAKHNKEKLNLIQKANAPHIKEMCDLIGLCHMWFMRGLNKVANSPDFVFRPGRVVEPDVEW